MLFLAKVAKCLDRKMMEVEKSSDGEMVEVDGEPTDEERSKKKIFSVTWLVRKMVREAHHEAINNMKITLKVQLIN